MICCCLRICAWLFVIDVFVNSVVTDSLIVGI